MREIYVWKIPRVTFLKIYAFERGKEYYSFWKTLPPLLALQQSAAPAPSSSQASPAKGAHTFCWPSCPALLQYYCFHWQSHMGPRYMERGWTGNSTRNVGTCYWSRPIQPSVLNPGTLAAVAPSIFIIRAEFL